MNFIIELVIWVLLTLITTAFLVGFGLAIMSVELLLIVGVVWAVAMSIGLFVLHDGDFF